MNRTRTGERVACICIQQNALDGSRVVLAKEFEEKDMLTSSQESKVGAKQMMTGHQFTGYLIYFFFCFHLISFPRVPVLSYLSGVETIKGISSRTFKRVELLKKNSLLKS